MKQKIEIHKKEILWWIRMILLIFVMLFLLFLPHLCRYINLLSGLFGVVCWLLLFSVSIIWPAVVIVLLAISFAKDKKKDGILVFLFCCFALIYGCFSYGGETRAALKDIINGPVEISFTDYTLNYKFHRMVRSYRRRPYNILCYEITTNSSLSNNRILVPLNAVEIDEFDYSDWRNKEYDRYAVLDNFQGYVKQSNYPLTIKIYPYTGIIAEQRSIDILQEALN